MKASNSNTTLVPTKSTAELVSIEAFHGIVWASFSLCVIAYSARMYIRYACFRHLFVEDYVMILALATLLTSCIVGQIYLPYVYEMVDTGNGDMLPGLNFTEHVRKANLGTLINLLLSYIGIWSIKLNFLLFFRRMGGQIRHYRVLWWVVAVFAVACGLVLLGTIPYNCLLAPPDIMFGYCGGRGAVSHEYTSSIISCVLDVVSDALIVSFPTMILWRVRISRRKKLVLTGVFFLIAFTIAIAIIRGSIFGGVYKSISENDVQVLNVTWLWFWLTIEFIVSFNIACLISFRALYTQRQKGSSAQIPQQYTVPGRSTATAHPRSHVGRQGTLLDTFREWEGDDDTSHEVSLLPLPPLGRSSIISAREQAWSALTKSDQDLEASTQRLPPVRLSS